MTIHADATSPLQLSLFMRFWWGRVVSAMGNQMMMVAMGWQIYNLTGSAWDLGLVGLAQFLPRTGADSTGRSRCGSR